MAHYIDKSALVAEIEKLYNGEIDTYTRNILDRLKSNIDTLEVKEMNLEKEFCDYFEKNFRISISGILLSKNDEPINTIKLLDFAKHFFELGMGVSNKAQKGEEV